ncbi:hypothetical protein FACS1894122_07590 [Alphaproteobacteria bacterium]|nr:hypothetical protein FACS1894122_07590 [Alphaproteobacteria bacterium]
MLIKRISYCCVVILAVIFMDCSATKKRSHKEAFVTDEDSASSQEELRKIKKKPRILDSSLNVSASKTSELQKGKNDRPGEFLEIKKMINEISDANYEAQKLVSIVTDMKEFEKYQNVGKIFAQRYNRDRPSYLSTQN